MSLSVSTSFSHHEALQDVPMLLKHLQQMFPQKHTKIPKDPTEAYQESLIRIGQAQVLDAIERLLAADEQREDVHNLKHSKQLLLPNIGT